MNIIPTQNKSVPIFSWCPNIEQSALDQMIVIANLPFVKHCALMPDAHMGMMMPIGGVIACDGVVIPNAVGVDIGCGMGAVKTTLKASDLTQEAKEKLLHSFGRSIPTGFDHNNDRRMAELKIKYMEKFVYMYDKLTAGILCDIPMPVDKPKMENTVFGQVGTLGGGNHFLEVQRDEEDNVWIMIHSGSRNIGKTVCDYFDKLAKTFNKDWYSSVPEDIGFLPTNTDAGRSYIKWMNFALSFAFLNRQVMLDSIMKDITHMYPNIDTGHFSKLINIHHNFANHENHKGQNLWVHRKGATEASTQTTGIIPGSMGTPSYIVEGLGHPDSLNSCSHGAGRVSSRTEFNKKMNTEEGMKAIEASMSGIVHSKFQKEVSRKRQETGQLDVSEAPQAYKDIEDVIKNELDLIKPSVKLYPLINMKG